MNKSMIRRIAAAVIAAVTAAPALPASSVSAENDPHSSNIIRETFGSLPLLEDTGMLREFAADGLQAANAAPDGIYLVYDAGDGYSLYTVEPLTDRIWFRLPAGADTQEAMQQILPVLKLYYPWLAVFMPQSFTCEEAVDVFTEPVTLFELPDRYFELVDHSETAGSEAIAQGILRELSRPGLLAEFYTWGQTAVYQKLSCYDTILSYDAVRFTEDGRQPNFDPDTAEAYLKEQDIACTVTAVTAESNPGQSYYRIVPESDADFGEQFALAAALYAALGCLPRIRGVFSAGMPITGENALTVPGDIDCDGRLGIADVILAIRISAEDPDIASAPCALYSADFDRDGAVTALDAAAMLRLLECGA